MKISWVMCDVLFCLVVSMVWNFVLYLRFGFYGG